MKKINIVIAVVLLLFCIGYFFMIKGLPDRNLENTLKSSFMPTLLLIIFMGLSVLLLIKNIALGTNEACDYMLTRRDLLGLLIVTALIFLYVFLMNITGFLIITPVVMFILMKLTGSSKIREAVIVSISASLLIYLLFDVLFKVQLPGGLVM